jgi:hypothetical protein
VSPQSVSDLILGQHFQSLIGQVQPRDGSRHQQGLSGGWHHSESAMFQSAVMQRAERAFVDAEDRAPQGAAQLVQEGVDRFGCHRQMYQSFAGSGSASGRAG